MKKKSVMTFVGLGSNLKGRLRPIQKAIEAIQADPDMSCIGVSPIYESKPLGGPRQNSFLNGVVQVRTSLSPSDLLKRLKGLEKVLGRKKGVRWGPRVIDLDILFYGRRKFNSPKLIIPHPRIQERLFVLAPLADLSPRLVHPHLRKTVRTLARSLTGSGQKVTIQFRWKKSRFQGLSRRRKPGKRSPL